MIKLTENNPDQVRFDLLVYFVLETECKNSSRMRLWTWQRSPGRSLSDSDIT